MTSKPKVSAHDISLFRAAVERARPLQQDKVSLDRPGPAPIPVQRQLDEQRVLVDMLSGPLDPEELETGEELTFARPGLQHLVLRRLRRGLCPVEDELDLHGLTVPAAREALAQFLRRTRAAHNRCVRIIHGKGNGSRNRRPVLKTKVGHWLQQRDEVLAFCSALPVDGGTGALYVLLKRY
jgi:DNA-nicking Smr family endonuclease